MLWNLLICHELSTPHPCYGTIKGVHNILFKDWNKKKRDVKKKVLIVHLGTMVWLLVTSVTKMQNRYVIYYDMFGNISIDSIVVPTSL